MKVFNISIKSEWGKWLLYTIGSIVLVGFLFLINNFTAFFNLILFIIQVLLGIIFGVWYFRLLLIFIQEIRKKEPKKKIGLSLGWSIFGIVTTILNLIVWVFLSNLAFNIPKIVFFIPATLAMVEIFYVFRKANRRGNKDWAIIFYNIFVYLYLFTWTLVDFGVDLPSILGVLFHTITSSFMWWQIATINTAAFFSPSFLFPIYMLNPRYYFAMPIEDYLAIRKADKEGIPLSQTEPSMDELSAELFKDWEERRILEEKEEDISKQKLPGERKPFFEERTKEKEDAELIEEIKKEMKKLEKEERKEKDEEYAKFISVNDLGLQMQQMVRRFDAFLRGVGIFVMIGLLLLCPVMIAGNISMNVLPSHQKTSFATNPNMKICFQGSVFSTTDVNGYFTNNWEEELEAEINWAKELHATHLRYDLKTRAIENNYSREILETGIPQIQAEGIKLVINIAGGFSITQKEYFNDVYEDASYIAQTFQPEYMIIFDELNGQLLNSIQQPTQLESWFPRFQNVSTKIRSLSPNTKIISSILSLGNGLDYFNTILKANLTNDVFGLSFFPVLFGWRINNLLAYTQAFHQTNTSQEFWLTAFGMETLNYGESAQAKFLTKILSMASNSEELNVDGICIYSLRDNTGFTLQRGLISHLGLVYYNGRKKKAFDVVKFSVAEILEL
ncbi:MAG: hypothetical protein GF308_02835 [Candidatus Heimdallarchaeota archaeon]|nr:hypothetical protein [Candidatus Heimdallarchaeota archaeon]